MSHPPQPWARRSHATSRPRFVTWPAGRPTACMSSDCASATLNMTPTCTSPARTSSPALAATSQLCPMLVSRAGIRGRDDPVDLFQLTPQLFVSGRAFTPPLFDQRLDQVFAVNPRRHTEG